MRIVFFSDIHGAHEKLHLPQGDILICSGDISKHGTVEEIKSFIDWFQFQPHYYKIFIAGNHDSGLERNITHELLVRLCRFQDSTQFYLEDEPCEIEGINFWGSPVTPKYGHYSAFTKERDELRNHWDKIPYNTDILITHGPPEFKCDLCFNSYLGDTDLSYHLQRVQPKLHLFGHIHESRGVDYDKYSTYINGVVTDYTGEIIKPCFIIDYDETITIIDNDGAY